MGKPGVTVYCRNVGFQGQKSIYRKIRGKKIRGIRGIEMAVSIVTSLTLAQPPACIDADSRAYHSASTCSEISIASFLR